MSESSMKNGLNLRTWNEQKIGRHARDTGVCFRSISDKEFVGLATGQMEGIQEVGVMSTWTEKEWAGSGCAHLCRAES